MTYKETIYQQHRDKLVNYIARLEKKLQDPKLTQGQYNAINGHLERQRTALEEGRVY